MATVQLRSPAEGRAYYDHKTASGKTSMEMMRGIKPRLPGIVYRQMLNDVMMTAAAAGQEGHRVRLLTTALPTHPLARSSEKRLPATPDCITWPSTLPDTAPAGNLVRPG